MQAYIEVKASHPDGFKNVLVDIVDFDRLDGRSLSIGSHGYAQMWTGKRVMLLHRWIMGVPDGTGYRAIVDHINRDVLDCRRGNLRLVTPTQSNLNRSVKMRDLPIGVYLTQNGKYHAAIKRHRKMTHLGTYDTMAAASSVVVQARKLIDAGWTLTPPA